MGRINELFPYDKLSFVVAWTPFLHLYQIPVYHIPEVEYAVLENFKKLMLIRTVRPDWIGPKVVLYHCKVLVWQTIDISMF
jgi:hypothetical protein